MKKHVETSFENQTASILTNIVVGFITEQLSLKITIFKQKIQKVLKKPKTTIDERVCVKTEKSKGFLDKQVF